MLPPLVTNQKIFGIVLEQYKVHIYKRSVLRRQSRVERDYTIRIGSTPTILYFVHIYRSFNMQGIYITNLQ